MVRQALAVREYGVAVLGRQSMRRLSSEINALTSTSYFLGAGRGGTVLFVFYKFHGVNRINDSFDYY